VSAFFPVTPVEPYLVGLAAASGYGPVGLGIVAAVGQTIGKTVIFLGVRGVFRSERLRRLTEAVARHRKRDRTADPEPSRTRERLRRLAGPARLRLRRMSGPAKAATAKLTALLERPALTVPILFLSAVTGLPPLLATSIYIASTPVSTPVVAGVCFVGRSVRFIAIAYAPQFILG
jgi:membrane protein YqaA with SNARE-associated domain